MTNIDTWGPYVRDRLDGWGKEFALYRDCEYLGHARKNMLQVLIDHKGEMPERPTGFKPLEVDLLALQIERIVTDIARDNVVLACVLRGYYCGSGRRKVERWETANLLIATAGFQPIHVRRYLVMQELGTATVGGVLRGLAIAA